MDSFKTRGIVTRRADYGESNCMLTVLSEDIGAISVCVYGVKSKKSKLRAGAQLLSYADFILNKKNGDIYRADAIEVLDNFYPVSEDLIKLSLANYLCELSQDAFADGDRRILRLLLNTLYMLAYKDIDPILAKAVFEMKLMQYAGYEPQTERCAHCGSSGELWYFDMEVGTVCKACAAKNVMQLPNGILEAVRYIISADEKKVFSFKVSDEVKKQLAELSEKYLLGKTERNYRSLDYFNKII